MPIPPEEKSLLDLIAKYTFLTHCKDNEQLDPGTYNEILWKLSREEMRRIKYYMERLNGHYEDMKAFLDGLNEESMKQIQ
jgi:hypothetical protein